MVDGLHGNDGESQLVNSPFDTATVLRAAVELGQLFETCYGPDGFRKMIQSAEETIVSSDVQRLFEELEFGHPAARYLALQAVSQKESVGDGALSVLLIGSALADQAQTLLDEGVQRTTIQNGFNRGLKVAHEELATVSRPVTDADDEVVTQVARASLNTYEHDELVTAIVDAVHLLAAERKRNRTGMSLSDYMFRTHSNNATPSAELIRGAILDREPVHPAMPEVVENPRIAVIGGGKKAGSGVEERTLLREGGSKGKGRTEVTFAPADYDDIEAFRDFEVEGIADQIAPLTAADVDAVFCTMGISDIGKQLLADAGIAGFRTLTEEMASFLAQSVGANVVMDVEKVTPADVGEAEELTVIHEGDEPYVRIAGSTTGTAGTVVLSGALNEYVSERERDLRSAIATTLDALENGGIVPGGGRIEVELATAIRNETASVGSREAVAMERYADALETVPSTLARNGGWDPLKVVPRLRATDKVGGFDSESGEITLTLSTGPCETERVVKTRLEAATQSVIQLVRIDEVLWANRKDSLEIEDPDPTPRPERDFDY